MKKHLKKVIVFIVICITLISTYPSLSQGQVESSFKRSSLEIDNNSQNFILSNNIVAVFLPEAPVWITQNHLVYLNQVVLEWNYDPEISNYDIYMNGTLLASISDSNYDVKFDSNGIYNYTLIAQNASGSSPMSEDLILNVQMLSFNPGLTQYNVSINGNEELSTYLRDSSQDGSEVSPFIIENFQFFSTESNPFGLRLSNITSHLIIKNVDISYCNYYNATLNQNFGYGIHILDCANIRIEHVSVFDSAFGIAIQNSTNITISDSDLIAIFGSKDRSGGIGIYFNRSEGLRFYNNSLVDITVNGILGTISEDICIMSNIFKGVVYGIEIEHCAMLTMENNSIIDSLSSYNYQIGLKLFDLDNGYFANNSIQKYYTGLEMEFVRNCTFQANIITNNLDMGLSIIYSTNNTFIQNDVIFNPSNFYMDSYSEDNLFINNRFEDPIPEIPIWITENQIVYTSTFQLEWIAEYAGFVELYLNDTYIEGVFENTYNYHFARSGMFIFTLKAFNNVGNSEMSLPLEIYAVVDENKLPQISCGEQDIYIDFTQPTIVINFTITDSTTSYPYYELFVDEVYIDSYSWESGVLEQYILENLEMGDHSFQIIASDGFGSNSDKTITIHVINFSPDIYILGDKFEYLKENRTSQFIEWGFIDPSVGDCSYTIIFNGITVTSNSPCSEGMTYQYYFPVMDLGTYSFTLIISDGLGQVTTTTIFVSIVDSFTSTNTETSTNSTNSTPDPFAELSVPGYPFTFLISVGFLIITSLFRKRRKENSIMV